LRREWVFRTVLAVLLCLAVALPALAAGNDSLVTAAELNDLLGNDNVVVVDVRSESDYASGHIPGAVRVDIGSIYATVGGVKKVAAPPAEFAGILSSLGISRDDTVVVYSSSSDLKHVTRFWWVMKLYGHQDVRVLDGGLKAWTGAGYELSTEAVTPDPAEYILTEEDVDQDAVATIEEVKAALDNENAVVVDARDNDYYVGRKTKAPRSGHIAGAILIPSAKLLNDDGTYRSAEELAELYASYGVTPDKEIIVYCNTGTTSTIQYFALTEILGYANVQNFDASMMGWSTDESLPVTTSYDFFTVDSSTAMVDAKTVNMPAAVFIKNDRSLIPAETLAASLEAELSLADGGIVLTKGDTALKLSYGSTDLLVNESVTQMDVAPVKVEGITFLPVRWVAEALGAEVVWYGADRKIAVGFKQ